MYYAVKQSIIKENVKPEDMVSHVEYVHQLIDSGVVMVSGPFSDAEGGGMIIVKLDNQNEVISLFEKDPAVQSGILKNEVRPYKLFFLSKEDVVV